MTVNMEVLKLETGDKSSTLATTFARLKFN